ncbi:MAG: hypothetical protein J6X28_05415 [Bacilli bacterium]|nr:hypothetical protein [Bacilli bacterium]
MPRKKKEEVKVEEKNDARWKHVLLITILVIVLMGVAGAMGYAIGGTKIINKVEKVEKVKQEVEEVTVSYELMRELSQKIDLILWNGKKDIYSETDNVNSYIFRADLLKGKPTIEDKQLIVLKSLEYRPLEGSSYESIEDITSWIEKDPTAKDEMGYLTYDEVNKAYQKLFGEELTTPAEEVGHCPYYKYNDQTKEFYQYPARCGGTSARHIAIYKSDYKVTKEAATVTIHIAYAVPVEGAEGYKVYADYEVQEGNIMGNPINEIDSVPYGYPSNYQLTAETAKECSEYQVTFKKDDNGNYYFYDLTQVK